jgi:hypothetical protein
MAAFSVLYTINIAVSNLSLQLVTVPVRSFSLSAERLLTRYTVPSSGSSINTSLHHPDFEHLLQGQVYPAQAR